jgi:transposase
MGRNYQIQEQHTAEELELKAKRTNDGRYRLRLMVIADILRDKSIGSKLLRSRYKVNPVTITTWVKWYNTGGLQALKDVSKGGRKEGNPLWDDTPFDALYAEIDKQGEYWSVPKMHIWLKEHFNIEVPYNTIDNRLRTTRYSFKTGRPKPYKGDKEAQELFKKKA